MVHCDARLYLVFEYVDQDLKHYMDLSAPGGFPADLVKVRACMGYTWGTCRVACAWCVHGVVAWCVHAVWCGVCVAWHVHMCARRVPRPPPSGLLTPPNSSQTSPCAMASPNLTQASGLVSPIARTALICCRSQVITSGRGGVQYTKKEE